MQLMLTIMLNAWMWSKWIFKRIQMVFTFAQRYLVVILVKIRRKSEDIIANTLAKNPFNAKYVEISLLERASASSIFERIPIVSNTNVQDVKPSLQGSTVWSTTSCDITISQMFNCQWQFVTLELKNKIAFKTLLYDCFNEFAWCVKILFFWDWGGRIYYISGMSF